MSRPDPMNRLSVAFVLLLLPAEGASALSTIRETPPPEEEREKPGPTFLFRFKVPRTRQVAGNVSANQPTEHPHVELSAGEMASRQADVAKFVGELKKSGRPIDRAGFVELYRRAGSFKVVHALLGQGVIDTDLSNRLGQLRAEIHNEVLDRLAASGQFGRRVGVNDFGSGAMNAKSDIDFTLYCDNPNVSGTALVGAYNKLFAQLAGNLPPGQFDLVAHRWEARIPDWRASCIEADFVQKLREGTALLKANPEAYFLEGAYAQQILRRSATGKTFTWIERTLGGGVKREKVNAAAETTFFYRADTRVSYAWGAAVGNWHFFNAHSHSRIDQAKYLLRSFDDGVSLTSRGGRTANYADLTPLQRKNLVVEIYREHPEAAGRYLAILETAVKIRQLNSTGREAFAPLIEWERRQAGGMEIDDDLALKMAEESLQRHGNRMLLENNRIAAEGRLKDWVAPDLPGKTYRTISDKGLPMLIDVDAGLVKRLQLAAFFEIRDGIELMDRAEVEKIKNDNPRFKKDIEILQRLIEKQRQMALAPDDFDARAAREYRRSLADTVLKDFEAVPAVYHSGGVRGLISHALSFEDKVSGRLERNTIDALAYVVSGLNPRVLVDLRRMRLRTSKADDQLVHTDWMGRMDKASSLVEIAKVYLEEGELNQKVLETIFWQGVTFLPGAGTYMSLTSGAGGVVTLVSTKLIPGYGPLLITLQLTKGVVELGMLTIFEPLQRDRLLLAYQGYLPPTGGGWVTLSTGQKFEVHSAVPSILEPIAGAGRKDLDARREAVYAFFHRRVTEAISRDPDFPFTEEELPSEWAEHEQRRIPGLIQAYVNDWFHATGDFASYDELTAFCSRLAGEDPAAFREQLESLLFKDYYTGKSRALQRKFEENEKEQQQIASLHRQVAAVNVGLDKVGEGMSADFTAAGEVILGHCLDTMPTVPPAMEIIAAPRIVELEPAGTPDEKVQAVPEVQFRAKVWASEAEFPGPWKVRWEVRRGGEKVAFDPESTGELKATMDKAVGTDASRLEVVATAFDADGKTIIESSVPLEVEKVKVGEDLPAEREAGAAGGTEAARPGAGAVTGIGDLVEEMERTAGAAAAAADRTREECDEAAAAGRKARERAKGLSGEVEALTGGIGDLEGRSTGVAGMGTAAADALGRANAAAGKLAVLRDRAAGLREKACSGADALERTAAPAERERLLAGIQAASAELEKLPPEAAQLLGSLRREVETIRRLSTELDALLAELGRAEERLAAAGRAAAELAAQVEEAEGTVEKARSALAGVDAQRAHGAEVLAEATRKAAAAGEDAAAALTELTGLEASIRTGREKVAPCADAAAAADVTPAATAAGDVRARLEELASRLQGLRSTVVEGGLRERLRGAAAEAQALLDFSEPFVESIGNRAADALACLGRGRASASLPAPLAVPDLGGKTRTMAESWLSDLGLVPVLTQAGPAPSPEQEGRVASQSPAPGAAARAGDAVTISIFAQSLVAVPDLLGASQAMATAHLADVGLRPQVTVGEGARTAGDEGKVASQSPAAGSRLPAGSSVSVTLWGSYVPVATPVETQESCSLKYPGTLLTRDPATGATDCQCPPGTAWSKVTRACLSLPAGLTGRIVAGGDCRHMPGTIRDSRTGECRCAVGTWDAGQRRCVDTAAVEREKLVAQKRAATACEEAISNIRIARGNRDSYSQRLAENAEREARALGCDPARIAEASGSGGGTDRPTPPGTGGAGQKASATCLVIERSGPGGIHLVYEQKAQGDHYNVYIFSVPQKGLADFQRQWDSTPGFRLVGRYDDYSRSVQAARQTCAKRAKPAGERTGSGDLGDCPCVDESGRRYNEWLGQECGTQSKDLRDYNCPPR